MNSLKSYKDKWGNEIAEKEVYFVENGGYVAEIELIPQNIFARFLRFLNILPNAHLMFIDSEVYKNTEYVSLKRTKKKGFLKGTLQTKKGAKTMQLSFDAKDLKNWKVSVCVERIYS